MIPMMLKHAMPFMLKGTGMAGNLQRAVATGAGGMRGAFMGGMRLPMYAAREADDMLMSKQMTPRVWNAEVGGTVNDYVEALAENAAMLSNRYGDPVYRTLLEQMSPIGNWMDDIAITPIFDDLGRAIDARPGISLPF